MKYFHNLNFIILNLNFTILVNNTTALMQFPTDHDLIHSISEGNKKAFNTLYQRHWEGLYKFAFFILRDNETCKDIVQDVFIWLWEHKEGLQMQSPQSYLKNGCKI